MSTQKTSEYRTIAREANGRYVVIATWSSFERAVGCCYGFHVAEKRTFIATKVARYLSVFVQNRDAEAFRSCWTTIPNTALRMDFDTEEKVEKAMAAVKPPSAPAQPRSGDVCNAVLLEKKTKNGGRIAAIPGTPWEGPITNSADIPSTLKAGDAVPLKVGAISANGKGAHIQFTWMGGRGS